MKRRILVDIGHPAHVHLFRHAIHEWQQRGDQVLVLARRRGIIEKLLSEYGIEFQTISTARSGLMFMGLEFLIRTWRVTFAAWRFKPTDLVGTSVSIGWASRLTGGTSYVFNEDDRDYLGFFPILAYTAAHHIVIPDCLRDAKGPRHITHQSYHELAYLHPAHFSRNKETPRKLLATNEERYFLFRLVSLQAHHDAGHTGISVEFSLKLIELLAPYGRIFVNSEHQLDPRLEKFRLRVTPAEFQDVLAGAAYLISDSQTTVMEAAVLGVPNIRINTFKSMCSVINELEDSFHLIRSFLPSEHDEILRLLRNDLTDLPALQKTFSQRLNKMLAKKTNFAQWITKTLLPPRSPTC